MARLNLNVFVRIVAGLSVALWLATLSVLSIPIGISVESIKVVSTVVTIEVALWWLFVKYGWKARVFRGWLVRIPAIAGPWEGLVQATWRDPATGQCLPEIPVEVDIKQTFDTVSCRVKSGQMTSQSQFAGITEDPDGTMRLVYTYVSVPDATVRDRSPMHHGTATLTIGLGAESTLDGAYWTDRRTTGSIQLRPKPPPDGPPPSMGHSQVLLPRSPGQGGSQL